MQAVSWLSKNKPVYLGLLSFVLSSAISLEFSTNLKNEIVSTNQNAVIAKTEKIADFLQEAIKRSVIDILTLQAFYNSHKDISYPQFEQFTQLFLNDINYIKTLEWIPKVEHKDRKDFEIQQTNTFNQFQIKKATANNRLEVSETKTNYYPINYIQPLAGNENMLGLDLSADRIQLETLEFARDTAEITTTEQINLLDEKDALHNFLMIAPIYHTGMIPTSLALRRAELKGFVLGSFKIANLINRVNEQALNDGFLMTLLDLDALTQPLLFGQRHKADYLFDLQLPQRTWQLELTMSDELRQKTLAPPLYHWALFCGFIISTLLALSAYALTRITQDSRQLKTLNSKIKGHNQNLEAKVDERTQSLAIKNEELNKNVTQLTQSREALNKLMLELKQQKEQAESKSLELARSNKELDEFAYVASHDLKAPLRGIDQLASWVIEDLEANEFTEIPEHLTAIRQRISRLERLLVDLFKYSKVGRHEEKVSQVDVQKLIKDVFILNAPSTQCSLSFSDNFPYKINVTAQFELIIRNLIGNAVKHADKEELHIEFDCSEQNNAYTFSIRDNGPGIDPKHFEQIFEMFKTLKPRDKVEGSGMGLALIKKVVNSYGGKVFVESSLGQGSTFYFNWPKNLHNK